MRSTRVLWVAGLAQLLVVLDTSIVNVALPTMQRDLGLAPTTVSWVTLAYALGFAGVLLVGARLSDVLGPGRALMWGMAAFAAASLLGGIASDGSVLIAARAAQGLGAAVASPATLTLLTITYPEGPQRIRALAIWTAVSLAGGGAGNILGGALTQWATWRSVFLIAVPLGLIAVLGARPLARGQAVRHAVKLPVVGALTVTAAFTVVTYALSGLSEGIARPGWWTVALLGLALAAAAVIQQWRSAHPLIPKNLWRNRSIVTGNLATLTAGMCFQASVWFFLTFVLQQHLKYEPFATGAAFLPLTLAMLIVNTWAAPRLLSRIDARHIALAGTLVAALGFAALAVVPVSGIVAVLLPSMVIGIGGGLFNTPITTIVTAGVSPVDVGAASGMMNIAKQFGGAAGLAVLSAANIFFADDRTAFTAMAGLMLISAVAIATIPAATDKRRMAYLLSRLESTGSWIRMRPPRERLRSFASRVLSHPAGSLAR